MSKRFKGKVVIVTGASSGVGAAAAKMFAAEGASVALAARSEDKLHEVVAGIDKHHGRAQSFPTDVGDPDACARLLESVAATFGGIDILVNNAGANQRGAVEKQDPADLAHIVRVNLIAPIVLTRLTLPYLRRRGAGSIVNVASIAGQTPMPDEATYGATKAGLRSFSFALAEELAGTGIRVAVVSPGPIDTPFIMDEIEDVPGYVFANPMSTAEEVAALVLDSAIDGTAERTIPAMTGYLAQVGSAVPALRRLLLPLLERQGQAAKEKYRQRARGDRHD
jgi:short-subunit dehydrogenase